MGINPRILKLRFRVWQFCADRDWNVTTPQISEGLGDASPQQVSAVLQSRGWAHRVRKTRGDDMGGATRFKDPSVDSASIADLAVTNEVTAGLLGVGDIA